jgi:hypothetical protein
MPPYMPRKLTPYEQRAMHEQRVRAARSALFDKMLRDALEG